MALKLSYPAFSLSAALGAIGGIVVAPITFPSYSVGVMLGLKGFVAAALGGFSSLVLAVVGGLGLGVVESLAQSKPTINIYLPPSADYPRNYVNISANRRAYLEAVSRRDLDSPFSSSDNLINLERTNVIRWFHNLSFADLAFDKQASLDYKRKILGISDIPSSVQILNSLTELAR